MSEQGKNSFYTEIRPIRRIAEFIRDQLKPFSSTLDNIEILEQEGKPEIEVCVFPFEGKQFIITVRETSSSEGKEDVIESSLKGQVEGFSVFQSVVSNSGYGYFLNGVPISDEEAGRMWERSPDNPKNKGDQSTISYSGEK